jgi:undecaprenyl-diphosphatase
MTELLQLDERLFYFVNSEWRNVLFDAVLPVLREKHTWFPLYLFLLVFFILNFRKNGLILILTLALTVGISDVVSSHLVKKTVRRARPCQVLDQTKDMHLMVNCGSGYSFPSSHAANHFSMAVFLMLTLSRVFRRVKVPLLIWATSIAYAQVYVGVHYPLDVVAGALLGTSVALSVYRLIIAARKGKDLLFEGSF